MFRAVDLALAEQALAGARARQANLEAVAAQTADQLDGLGARSVLTASGRAERRRCQTQLAADRAAVERAKAGRIAIVAVQRREAERGLGDAAVAAEQAARRRWGRPDQAAITNAGQEVERQRQRLQQAVAAQSDLEQRLSELVEHQHHRGRVLAETRPRRVELGGTLGEIDGALDRTRPGRVQVLIEARAERLIDLLGAPPDHPTTRALWQHLANVVETHLDRQLPAPTWETLRHDLREARELIAEQAAPTRPPSPLAQPTPDRLAARQAIAMHRQAIQLNEHAEETPGGPTPDLGL